MTVDASHKTRSLWLIGMLHGFTHLYQVALMPLYLPMKEGLNLSSTAHATFLVTLLMLAYFIPAYPMGILADRVSRKKLLSLGLAFNGLGFIGLALAPNYPVALLAVVISGVGGSCFHPAATAMIARLFPVQTGKALGLIGMGAAVGFFIGPIYSGWRASVTGDWRSPVLELGVLGLLGAALFQWLAADTPTLIHRREVHAAKEKLFSTSAGLVLFLAAAFAFSLRDFTGSSMGSFGSLFLQNAHGFSLKETGVALSGIFLASVISNPLFGHLSDRGRMRWSGFVLCVAAVLVALFPHLPRGWFFVTFMAYGFFFMASYPMVEAGVMQVVHDSMRGRAFGLWITIGGLIGSLSHWFVGGWVEALGERAHTASGYFPHYFALGGLLLLSMLGLPCLHAIRRREAHEHEPPASPALATPPAVAK